MAAISARASSAFSPSVSRHRSSTRWAAAFVPVRITELSVAEEAFDANLNPIRAKLSLGLRVLSVDDLGFDSKGGGLFMGYLQAKERLASQAAGSDFRSLGIPGVF